MSSERTSNKSTYSSSGPIILSQPNHILGILVNQ